MGRPVRQSAEIQELAVRTVLEHAADVAIFVLMIAERAGIDLRAAIDRKIDANERRYTVEKHRGIAEKERK
jgi:NTP pyrophosphatase (non-canonical NTP hydrolase)